MIDDNEFAAIEKKEADIDTRLREIARKADVSMNDIYNLVFRQYKTDNQLREQVNKNSTLKVEEDRIRLAGKQFLVEDYFVTKKLRSIQLKSRRKMKIQKFFSVFRAKKKATK